MRIHRTRVGGGSYPQEVTRGRRRYAGLVIVVLAGLLGGLLVAPTPAQAASGPLRIMLEGDSITQGHDGDYTWRYRFYRELVRQHVRFDFVGPRTSLWVEPGFKSSQYADPHFDQHHFARAGSTLLVHSYQVHDQVAAEQPDIIVLEAGINDLRAGRTPAQTDSYLRTWIANARSAKPDVKIVVASILDATDVARPWLPERIREFRALQATTVHDLSTSQSPIMLADTDQGWGVMADTYDNLHPTPTGETLIAQRIAETFERLGVLRQQPHIYRITAWGRIARAQARVLGRRVVLTWDRQALNGVKIKFRRVGRHWQTTKLNRGASMVTGRLRPGRYQFKIKMIRARMNTDYGPPVRVVIRRGRSHRQ
jgi:lysophospholipase L1-like esterase